MAKPKTSVADVPHMRKMWDKKKNKEKPEDVSVHSTDSKWWKCPDCGCEWPATPKARYNSSGKCPCHVQNKVIWRGVNDVLTIVKGLAAFIDENNDFEAIYEEGVDSSLPVNFKCDECGRRWNDKLKTMIRKDGNGGYVTAGCPHYNAKNRMSSDVPYCTEVEAIIKFWDYDNPMNPALVRSNSPDRAHFICPTCGYDWTTEIRAQKRGTGKCKCCELQMVTRKGWTDVFTLIPDSKRYFNFNKNKGIDIFSINLRDAKTMIDWKCPDPTCGYEWQSVMAARIKGNKEEGYTFAGCRKCKDRTRITPVASAPKLLKYWDFKKNKARGLDPNLTSAYSTEPADWYCKECGFEWELPIKTVMNGDGKCPFCSGKSWAIMKGKKDVITMCPGFDTIYDFDENEKRGIDIFKEGVWSRTEAHFKCKKCGNEWDSRICDRVRKEDDGSYRLVDCPKCSNKTFRQVPYSEEFPVLAQMYREDLNGIPLDSIRGYEGVCKTYYHWECLTCGETFESTLNSMRMSYDTPTKGCPYCSHTKPRDGESFADIHPELMDEYDPSNTINPYEVLPNCKDSVNWICSTCGHNWPATFALRHAGGGNCPVCNHSYVVPDKTSFAAVYPDLVKYWADSNERRADEVFWDASIWLRFTCPVCNQEHGAYIEDFVAGDSCPFCKEIRVSPETNSLKAVYPDIARRWSPNNSFDPETIFPTSWEWAKWICDTCTGEYNARVKDVVNGTDECPYCNYRLPLPGYNTFGDLHPDLVEELDPLANYLLPKSPFEVLDTSIVKFWFNCKNDPKHKYPMSPRDRLMFQKRNREPCLYCRGHRRKLNHFVSYEKK